MAPFGLTEEQIRQIGMNPKCGRSKLAEILGFADIDEEDERRKAITLDFYFDNLMFAIKHGFNYEESSRVLDFAAEMLSEFKDKSMVETVELYINKCQQFQGKIRDNNLKSFAKYFFTTFIEHYNLFKLVMCADQEKQIHKHLLQLDCPFNCQQIVDAKSLELYDYEKKIMEINQAEMLSLEERTQRYERDRQNDRIDLDTSIEKIDSLDVPVKQKDLKKLICEIARANLSSSMHEIEARIESTMVGLQFDLERNSIPRPPDAAMPQSGNGQKKAKLDRPSSKASRNSSRASKIA